MSVDMKHKRTSPKHEKEHPKIRTVILHNVLITLLIMGVSTIMAQAFFHYSRNSTSVAIIYVLAVMLVARYTTGYITGWIYHRNHCGGFWRIFCQLCFYFSIYEL